MRLYPRPALAGRGTHCEAMGATMMFLRGEARHASSVLPGSSPHEDSVCKNDELASTGDDGGIMSFPLGAQAPVEALEVLIPMLRASKGRHIDGLAQPGATAGNMAWPSRSADWSSKGATPSRH